MYYTTEKLKYLFTVVLYPMDEREQILLENIAEYYALGVEAMDRKKYNSATTLFFKAIAALCDFAILRKEKAVPSSHSHRFRILEERFPALYAIADRDFPFYQNSYTQKMDEETARLLKEDVESIKKNLGI